MGSIFVLTGWVYFFGDADLFVGWFASVTKSQLATSEHFSFQIKAFNLERVGSEDGFPHKKYWILWLDSRARPHWKNTSKKRSSSWGDLISHCSIVSWPFLMLSTVLVSLFQTIKMTRVGVNSLLFCPASFFGKPFWEIRSRNFTWEFLPLDVIPLSFYVWCQ